jgi:tetratricopeptide (TPR) repeat protein
MAELTTLRESMTERARRCARGVAIALVALVALVTQSIPSPAAATTDQERTRRAMREIYEEIQTLLPLSVDDQAFKSPEFRARIEAALAALTVSASELGAHTMGQPRQVEFLANALSREANGALARFESGRIESAQFFVRRLTDYCVACHSRLPSPTDAPLTRGFLKQGNLARQPLENRAELQIATRQFDEALASYEALLASPTRHAAEFLQPLTRYLRLAIGVKGDLARPLPILHRLSAREDLSESMRTDLTSWIDSLEKYAMRDRLPPTLAAARTVLADLGAQSRAPHDRRALVQDLIAASLLHRYLEAQPDDAHRHLAEAYFLLGSIESRLNANYRFFEAEFYLETAIRMAPQDPVAQRAFKLLEQETILGWVGSGGSNMPEPVRQNIEHLRALVYPDSTSPER